MSERQTQASSPLYYPYTYSPTSTPKTQPENHPHLHTSKAAPRINQLKPKSHPHPKPLAKPPSSPRTALADISPSIRNHNNLPPESIEYSEVKPFFNLNQLGLLCGGSNSKVSVAGCLCGSTCPWRQAWTKNATRKDEELFTSLLKISPTGPNRSQIGKDLSRTHPLCPTFSTNASFREMLQEVLVAYSVYDMEVGYVQGLNMIVGVLLYHIKDAEHTFWALVEMMEEQQLRMIYLQGLDYLKQHQNKFQFYFETKINDLYHFMKEKGATIEVFLHGWLLTLMSNCVPIEHMHRVIHSFRKEGWNWLYRLILAYLLFLKEKLMLSTDEGDLLLGLSCDDPGEIGDKWEQIIDAAHNLQL